MQHRRLAGLASVLGLASALSIGCNSETKVPLADAPPVAAPSPQPVPADAQRGGGGGSSGNMQVNPAADS